MIQADYNTLLRQAHMTAHDYMLNAKHDIDEIFGAGFAQKHPELVAAYMKVAAMDFGASCLAKEIGEAMNTLGDDIKAGLVEIAENVRTDHPLQGQTFEGITEALQNIAGLFDLYSCGKSNS